MGSSRSLLVKQFLTESNLITFIALLLSIGTVWLVLPSFNSLVSKELSLVDFMQPLIFVGLIIIALIIGTIAGLYPAIVISSIQSAVVLKGEYKSSTKGVWLRNTLIIFQFFISITMISGMLMLNKQMMFMRNKQLGFNKENIIVIDQAQVLGQQQNSFKNGGLCVSHVYMACLSLICMCVYPLMCMACACVHPLWPWRGVS